ncbi:hypothetical protein GW17_00018694 [Ensete ventricosum]|nr:hypothetical protein GW17_00018694 [Ensete ventricosum]
MALIDRVHGVVRIIGAMDNKADGLRKEIQELKASVGSNAVVVAEQRASEAQSLVDHYKIELEEATRRRESLEIMEDELLNLTCNTDALNVDLPKKAVADYKKLAGFEMGLMWMGQVSYEYGYQVALAGFWARYPKLEVEEDPFKILPEDSMQQGKRVADHSQALCKGGWPWSGPLQGWLATYKGAVRCGQGPLQGQPPIGAAHPQRSPAGTTFVGGPTDQVDARGDSASPRAIAPNHGQRRSLTVHNIIACTVATTTTVG